MDERRADLTAARALLALAASGLVALGALGCGSSQPSAPAADATRPPTAADAAIGVLMRPANGARDALPVAIAGQKIMRGQIDAGSARLAQALGRRVWLARSPDGAAVCVVSAGSLSCANLDELARRGLAPALSGRRGEPLHVSGIAVDAVKTVELTLADGSRRAVTVAGNFFQVDLRTMPRTLSWNGPHGRETFRFPSLSRPLTAVSPAAG